MKLISSFFLILALIFFYGCPGPNGQTVNPIEILYPPPAKSICDVPENQQNSVICKVMAYLHETPEQFNDQLLDVSLIGLWQKWWNKDQLKNSISKVRQYVVKTKNMNLSLLLDFMKTNSETDEYMKAMLSRKLSRLQIPQYVDLVFTPVDFQMVIYALDSQDAQL